MSKKVIAVSILIIIVGMLWWGFSPKVENTSTINVAPVPTPVPTSNVPKTFKFDNSTDLKVELEKVNPQILDSDYE